MTELLIVLLAVVWTAVLVPPWVRSLREGRPGDSISSFRRQLNVLERGTHESMPAYRRPNTGRPFGEPGYSGYGGSVPMNRPGPARSAYGARRPASPSPYARQRRRQVLLTLVAAFLITGSMALTAGGTLLVGVFLISTLALIGYVALLVQLQRQATMYRSSSRYRSAA
ncbi:MAG: hypothetical protein AB7N61_17370 [Acidimicrobiia bacterium]